MAEPQFHVLLPGRSLGPYDRRTIVGMRVRQALASDDRLVGVDGRRLTVGELLDERNRAVRRATHRSSGFSIVLATFDALLLGMEGKAHGVPRFRGPIELRIQADGVLRIAGRFRQGWRSREDRVKLRLADVRYARVGGSTVELWLQSPDDGTVLQRLVLDLLTAEAAGELVDCLPDATPAPLVLASGYPWQRGRWPLRMRWLALAGAGLVAAAAAAWVAAAG